MTVLEDLIQSLSRLPGVGRKSASRMAYHLLQTDQEYNTRLARLIHGIQKRVQRCSRCGSFTEEGHDPCAICSSPNRDRRCICVVEHPQDVLTLEAAGAFHGLFHVLDGVISPLDGIGPDELNLAALVQRIREEQIGEIIIATNPTEEGDTTALYISHLVKAEGIRVTRLASGIPVGGDLEYADRITIARSLRGRTLLESLE